MPIAVVKVTRDTLGSWTKITDALEHVGITVHRQAVESDKFIVLGGRYENPVALKGKRTLFFHADEWDPPGYGWKHIFGPLVSAFYDELIDCTRLSLQQIVAEVKGRVDAEKR